MEIFDKFDRKSLAALRARNLPRVIATDLFDPTPATDPEAIANVAAEMAIADDYLKAFTRAKDGCVCCGAVQGGLLFGFFTWGLAHGEGYCSQCGYPGRAVHRIGDIGVLRHFILQYHPDALSFDEETHAPSEAHPA